MDSQQLNKAVGAVCVAGLVFLFGKWGVDTLTTRGEMDAGGHGDSHSEETELAFAYTVEVADSGADAEGDGSAEVNPAVYLAAADAAAGEKDFGKCKACHSLEPGVDKVGPSLNGILNRQTATEEGFAYSDGMAALGAEGHTWTAEELFKFLGDVKGTVPGTKMSFPGIKKEQDRADLIAFLGGDDFDASSYEAAANATASESAEAAPAAEAAATEEAPAEETAALVGDPVKGEKVFNKCKACHSVEPGENRVGPTLHEIVDRPTASIADFKYSDAMAELGAEGHIWTDEELTKFLRNPKELVPGTKMSFPGLRKDQEIADVIAYLAEN